MIAFLNRKRPYVFGASSASGWKSVRTLTVLLVTVVLAAQGAWFYIFGFVQVSNLLAVTHFLTLGFLGWVLANAFGILVSSQIHRVLSVPDDVEGTDLFTLEENQQTIAHVRSMQRQLEEQKWLAKMGEFAAQIAHDIRSPLSALNMAAANLDGVEENRRLLIKTATGRINDIANQLLRKGKTEKHDEDESNEPVMLASLLDRLVSEKRLEYRTKDIVQIHVDCSQGYGLFAKIKSMSFSQVISNLVNNAVEALERPGSVTISIFAKQDSITTRVADTGKGMSPEILAKLGTLGFSYGKSGGFSGSGLGVHHARSTIEKVGGQFSIQSKEGTGSTVTIVLPRAEPPSWFLQEIRLSHEMEVVSFDDDLTIHQVWHERLTSAAPKTKHVRISSIEAFNRWMKHHDSPNTVFFIDFEFAGERSNGLDIIESHGLTARATLVTSRFDDPALRARAQKLGVQILPKNLAPFIPIVLNSQKARSVFIENVESVPTARMEL